MSNEDEVFYGLPKEVKFCKKCVISNQRPNSTIEFKNTGGEKKRVINFDKDGICSACVFHEEKETGIDWELRDKKLELNHYSQVLDSPKPAPRFEMINANLKLAQLTPNLARLLIHTDVSSSDPISPLTPLLTNEETALDDTTAESPAERVTSQATPPSALYIPRSEEAIKAIKNMHLHSANLRAGPPTPPPTIPPTQWPTTLPQPPPPPPTAPTPPPRPSF